MGFQHIRTPTTAIIIGAVLLALLLMPCLVIYDTGKYMTDMVSVIRDAKANILYATKMGAPKSRVIKGDQSRLYYFREISTVLQRWRHTSHNANVLAGLSAGLQERGIALIVVPVPTKAEIYWNLRAGDKKRIQRHRKIDTFFEKLKILQVPFVDLYTPMIQAKDSGGLYYDLDSHWNSLGKSIAAQALLAALSQFATVDSFRQKLDLVDTNHCFEPDLAGTLLGEHKNLCIEEMAIRDSAGNGFALRQQSNILILGDSFAEKGKDTGMHFGAFVSYQLGYKVGTVSSLAVGGKSTAEKVNEIVRKSRVTPQVVVLLFSARKLPYKMEALSSGP